MGHNIEIKARARDFERQRLRAEALASGAAEHLVQEDTFFNVPAGRLKLRRLGDGSAELIQYDRDDSPGPKASRYAVFRTTDPVDAVLAILALIVFFYAAAPLVEACTDTEVFSPESIAARRETLLEQVTTLLVPNGKHA